MEKKFVIYFFLFLGAALIISSCEKDTVFKPVVIMQNPDVKVGQAYQGGLVFYILKPYDHGYELHTTHGLIMDTLGNIGATSPTDLGTPLQWSAGSCKMLGATRVIPGTGYSNTNIIVDSLGAGSYAAKLCSDLVVNGYSDWYLPNDNEMRHLLGYGLYANALTNMYWTSTELDDCEARTFYKESINVMTSGLGKNGTAYVRAIRAF